MEQKQVILSALSVGVGVGVGLGLVSGSALGRWTGASTSAAAAAAGGISADEMQLELLRLVVDGKESKVTFDDFPYYLSQRTRVLLTSAAYVHLNHLDVSKHTRNLSPASRAILLSGPAELYQQMLAKALAHHFEAKLLLLDITDFSLKMQSKYGIAKKDSVSPVSVYSLHRSISEATLERMSSFLGSFSSLPSREDKGGTLWRQSSGLDATARNTEGVNNSLKPQRSSSVSSDMCSSISFPSSSSNAGSSEYRMGLLLISATVLSHGIKHFVQEGIKWREIIPLKWGHVKKSWNLKDLKESPKTRVTEKQNFLQPKTDGENASISKPLEVPPDNEFEKRIRPEVIPPNEIGVTFADIGALDEIKESLRTQLVMLLFRRPDLFNGGTFLKPCKRHTAFWSSRYRQNMLAKAISWRSGCKLQNVSMSTILQNGLEKTKRNVRALFTLAAKNYGRSAIGGEQRNDTENPAVQRKSRRHRFQRACSNDRSNVWKQNLCVTAAYRPEKKQRDEEGQSSEDASAPKEETKEEKIGTISSGAGESSKHVAASFASEGSIMAELKQWNELYGEGGSRKKQQLSYFL
ncbi:UNVERIFIED_CONTAM: protein MSP1 [Sesamum calycinum]|uniref:Protein MSP1 n=1 Tax=Sesamum calycinum TaxID=2727403 RepID=A0AAW2RQF1_9LAMI